MREFSRNPKGSDDEKSPEQIGKRSAGRPTTSRNDAAERATSTSGAAVHISPTSRKILDRTTRSLGKALKRLADN
jgi:hypothetical protein